MTERVEAEREVRKSQQRYASLSEHNPNGVFSLDLEGNLLSVNPALREITGHTMEELIEKGPIAAHRPGRSGDALRSITRSPLAAYLVTSSLSCCTKTAAGWKPARR